MIAEDGRPARRPLERQGWFKSSFSNGSGACVEVNFSDDLVLVRDTKDHGTGETLRVSLRQWAAFLDELVGQRATDEDSALSIRTLTQGETLLKSTASGAELVFTPDEWRMFLAGVLAGEFHYRVLAATAG